MNLNLRLEGPAGAPVVMLAHSLGNNLSMWEPQLAALAERHRVLRYDHRGHGDSPRPPGPYTVEQIAGDALVLADSLGIERFAFCGLSLGGLVGQWLGLHAASRLERLVLASTAARIGTTELWNARLEAVRGGGMNVVVDAAIERSFTPDFRARAPETVARLRATLLANSAETYIAAIAAVRDFDVRETISQVRVPTLVISATGDVSTPPADGHFLAENIRGARYHELDAAHLSNLEAPEAFTAALLDFLG
jgi:3-oxoadipate enol-lactonase